MALGFCRVCEKLVAIRLHALPGKALADVVEVQGSVIRDTSRRTEWRPVEHEDDDGKPCVGVKRPL